MPRARTPVATRFWAKVEVRGVDDCWPWTGSRRNGYGQLGRPGRQGEGKQPYYAHRLSYALASGLDHDKVQGVVRHLCHNRACVNPRHLALGTQKENIEESAKLGRIGRPRG